MKKRLSKMANYIYTPVHNIINMDQNQVFPSKNMNMAHHNTFHHYNMGNIECKNPQQNYILHNFSAYYTQGNISQNNYHPPNEEKKKSGEYTEDIIINHNVKSSNIRTTLLQNVPLSSLNKTEPFQVPNLNLNSSENLHILNLNLNLNKCDVSMNSNLKKAENAPMAYQSEIENEQSSNSNNTEIAPISSTNKTENALVPNFKKKSLQFKKTGGLFHCDICKYTSEKVSSVKSHHMIHTGEKPFKCDLCTKAFRQKEHLKNHRMTHTKEKLFFCNECKYSCGVRSKMDQHNLIHKGIKPYVCTKCDYRCRTPFVMKKHVAKCGIQKNKCKTCSKSFSKPAALAIHRLKHLDYFKYTCDICNYTTKLKQRFEAHFYKEHPSKKIHICGKCNYFCLKKSDLKIHKSSHDGKEWFTCSICQFSSKTKNILKDHIISSHNDESSQNNNKTPELLTNNDSTSINQENLISDSNMKSKNTESTQKMTQLHVQSNVRPETKTVDSVDSVDGNQGNLVSNRLDAKDRLYFCDICKFSSRRHRSVKVHKLLHTGERPFLCDLCPASYTRKHHLLKHQHLHLSGKDGKESKAMTIITCDVCSFTCAHKASLQRHQLLHSEKNPNCEDFSIANMQKFPCNICKLKYTKEPHLIKHLKSHLEKGELAGFQYDPSSSKSALEQFCHFNQHQYVAQQEELLQQQYKDICKKINDTYHCNLCEFSTKNLSSIKVHHLIHTGEKPYKCDLCSASYRRKQHLQLHKNRHGKKTTYLCHLCDFKSIEKCKMEDHRLTHEKTDVFTCNNCKLSFTELDQQLAHSEDCVPIMCSICAMVFFDQKLFDIHESHHNRDRSPVNRCDSEAFGAADEVLKDETPDPYDSEIEENMPLKLIKMENMNVKDDFDDMFTVASDDFHNYDDGDGEGDNYVPNEDALINVPIKKVLKKRHKKFKKRLKTIEKTSGKYKRNQEKRVNGLYHCEFCHYSNVRLNSVKVHRMIHTCERPFLCDICSASFRQKEHLIKHKKTHTTIRDKNAKTHDKDKMFVCSTCGFHCRLKATLQKHESKCLTWMHNCNTCDESFSSRSELIKHRSIHVQLRNYDCELCEFTAGNLLFLKKHTLKHSRMLYLCYVCGFTSVYKSLMQEHRATHNTKKVAKNDSKITNRDSNFDYANDRPYNLSDRNSLKPTFKDGLDNVLQNDLQDSTPVLTTPENVHTKEGDLYHTFNNSEVKQGRPRKYKLSEFKKENDLYICDFCDYSNTRVNSVKVHRMTHTDERPFPCDLCTKSFRQKMHLRKHKISHSKEKMFACDECDFSCRYKSSLDLHKLKHTGVKPYVCDKCLSSYRTQLEMERHIKKCF